MQKIYNPVTRITRLEYRNKNSPYQAKNLFKGLKFYPNVNEKTTLLARSATLNKLLLLPLTSKFNNTLQYNMLESID